MNNCVIMRKTNEEKGLYLKLKKMKNKKIEKNRKKLLTLKTLFVIL